MRSTTVEETAQNHPQDNCEICARKHVIYKERLSLGMAETLRLIAYSVAMMQKNCIHASKEAGLHHNAICNLSKLCFHGLIASVDEAYINRHRPDVKGVSGFYCLTAKGAAFLRGEAVPRVAIVLHGTNYGYDLESGMVTIHELHVSPLRDPYFDTIDTIQRTVVYPDGRLL